MANGSNNKRSSTTNDSSTTQHDNNNHTGNHQILNISTSATSASSLQQSSVTSTSPVPNNPRPTANRVVHLSGAVECFNNYENGSQDFSHATIKSSRTGYSFNNIGSGLQTFRGAEIRFVDESSKRIASILPWKRDYMPHSGTLNSFNNNESGSQTMVSSLITEEVLVCSFVSAFIQRI